MDNLLKIQLGRLNFFCTSKNIKKNHEEKQIE